MTAVTSRFSSQSAHPATIGSATPPACANSLVRDLKAAKSPISAATVSDLAARVRELEADNYKTGEREAKSLARIQQLMAERDALRAENERLRQALHSIPDTILSPEFYGDTEWGQQIVAALAARRSRE